MSVRPSVCLSVCTKRSYWSGTDLRNSSKLSKGAFRLVKKRTDEALLLVGNRPSEFFGAVKRSIPIGQEADRRSAPIGWEPTFGILRSCQRETSDWSRSGPTKRSYWSGTDLRNSSKLSKGAFRLIKKRTDEALLFVGKTEHSDRLGPGGSGHGVLQSF